MKQLLASIALTASVAVLGYLGVNMTLEGAVRQQLQRLANESPVAGLEFGQAWFQDMSLSPRGTVTWRNVRVPFRRAQGEFYRGGSQLLFTAKSLTLGPREGKDEYQVEAVGAGIGLDRAAESAAGNWQSEGYRGAGYSIDSFSFNVAMTESEPAQSMRAALSKLGEMLTLEGSALPFQLVGRAKIPVGDHQVEVPLSVREAGGRWAIQLDPEALKAAGAKLAEPLTADEVAFAAEYPLWAPVMIEIRDYVRSSVSKARDQDPSLPERAYAHLIWSYLLSREIGHGYAKEAIGRYLSGLKGAEAEKAMDLQNAEVGRRFAADGIEQRRLSELAKSDPTVMRKATSVRWSIK